MGRPLAGPDFARATGYALWRLRTELAPELGYHSLAHTRDEVVPAVARLATCAGVTGGYRALLLGAYYHDLGFVEQRADHERAGIRVAQAVLLGFGFDRAAVAVISGLILATRLPQTPHTALEAILADADLDMLGRADFWARHRALRAELAAYGPPVSDAVWYWGQ